MRENWNRRALGVKRRPTCPTAIATATAPPTSSIGRAAKAAVSRPRPSRPTAVPTLGWAMAWVVSWAKALTRLAASPPSHGRSDTATSRLAHPLSSVERATVPSSRISLRCLAVGFSVRSDLSAMLRPRRAAPWPDPPG